MRPTFGSHKCDRVLVTFIALLQYMNHFENADEIRNGNLEMQPEYYNAFACESLHERYKVMGNKLPLEIMADVDKEYYYNQWAQKYIRI